MNYLENWHKNAQLISSPLSIKPLISRNIVSYIYNTFYTFFGIKYFNEKNPGGRPIEKINWLNSLLSNENYIGCIGALYEICILIDYSKSLTSNIQNDLQSKKKSPQNLRSLFFELYIFYILDKNKIANNKKIFENEKELEGTCTFLGKEYLFECRKVFLPKINELVIQTRLMTEFMNCSKTMKMGQGMICTIKLKDAMADKSLSHFEMRIKEFFKTYNNSIGTFSTIDYFVEDKYGTFKVIDYSMANYIETTNPKNYDILMYIIPPNDLIAGKPNRYSAKVENNFFIAEEKLYKKLENVLKEKKKQHKNSAYKNQIIFIGSESFPEIQMGLFQHNQMFNYDKVKSIYERLNMESIVCIIRKHYDNFQPSIYIDSFYTEKDKNVSDLIEKFIKKN